VAEYLDSLRRGGAGRTTRISTCIGLASDNCETSYPRQAYTPGVGHQNAARKEGLPSPGGCQALRELGTGRVITASPWGIGRPGAVEMLRPGPAQKARPHSRKSGMPRNRIDRNAQNHRYPTPKRGIISARTSERRVTPEHGTRVSLRTPVNSSSERIDRRTCTNQFLCFGYLVPGIRGLDCGERRGFTA
jgi:hypothetical protein